MAVAREKGKAGKSVWKSHTAIRVSQKGKGWTQLAQTSASEKLLPAGLQAVQGYPRDTSRGLSGTST